MISLSSILEMRHGLLKKRERKDGMPKNHDPKNKGTHEGSSVEKKIGHMKVQEKKGGIYILI